MKEKFHRGIPWTRTQLKDLHDAYRSGLPIKQIAIKVARTESAVQKKLAELGLTNRRKLWTSEEDARLLGLFELGFSNKEIAQKMARPYRAIGIRLLRLGQRRKTVNAWENYVREDFWTKEEIDKAKRLMNVGYSGREIAERLGRNRGSLFNKLSQIGIKFPKKTATQESVSRRVYAILNENYFSRITTQTKAYFLGWMITDGYVGDYINTTRGKTSSNRVGLKLSIKDKHVLEEFRQELGSDYPIKIVKSRGPQVFHNRLTGETTTITGGKQCSLDLSSVKLKTDLARLGVHPRKTYTAVFPARLKKKYFPGFIAGLFSGDGSVDRKKNHKTGTLLRSTFCGTYDLVRSVSNVLGHSIGYDTNKKIQKAKSSKSLYRIELNQSETIALYHWLRKNGTSMMSRKMTLIEEQIEYIKARPRGPHGERKILLANLKNGTVSEYPSVKATAAFLNLNSSYLIACIQKGKLLRRGKYKAKYKI